MTHRIRPCLWFDHGEARRAVEFYAGIFPDTHVDTAWPAPADYPDGAAGQELAVEFTLLGTPVFGLNGGPGHPHTDAFSFSVETANQAETDRYWNALVADGGREIACGWCQDRFGLSWQIVPRQLNEGMTDPDRAAAARVMRAMMGMVKIDVAAIERARSGEAEPA